MVLEVIEESCRLLGSGSLSFWNRRGIFEIEQRQAERSSLIRDLGRLRCIFP